MYVDKTKVRLFTDSLVSGIGWGVGSILGAALLFALIGFLIARVKAIPIIGEFVYGVIVEVQKLQGN